jgi:threonyl-tRNA synthetase
MFPEAKYTIGPPVEDGFYYDFDLPRSLTPGRFEVIEKRMRQIIAGRTMSLRSRSFRPKKRARSSRTSPTSWS